MTGATIFLSKSLGKDPKTRAPKSASLLNQALPCTIITSKQNMLYRTINTSTSRASFRFSFFQGTSFCYAVSASVCVCVWLGVVEGGVNGRWLAVLVWFSRWHTGAPVAVGHYQWPQDSHTCETHYVLTKHWKELVLFLSDSGGQLKRFEGSAITNCWFKRDRLGQAATIMGLLFISLHGAITISTRGLYVMWLLSGWSFRMVFVGKILVQCSILMGNYNVGLIFFILYHRYYGN